MKNFREGTRSSPHALLQLDKVYRYLVTPLGDYSKIMEIFPPLPFHFTT